MTTITVLHARLCRLIVFGTEDEVYAAAVDLARAARS